MKLKNNIGGQLNRRQIIKITKQNPKKKKDKKEENIIKKSDKPPKHDLASKNCNPWNLGSRFIQEAQSSTNLILKNEIGENILLKKLAEEK